MFFFIYRNIKMADFSSNQSSIIYSEMRAWGNLNGTCISRLVSLNSYRHLATCSNMDNTLDRFQDSRWDYEITWFRIISIILIFKVFIHSFKIFNIFTKRDSFLSKTRASRFSSWTTWAIFSDGQASFFHQRDTARPGAR